jgi:hypothetical protein
VAGKKPTVSPTAPPSFEPITAPIPIESMSAPIPFEFMESADDYFESGYESEEEEEYP